jgi:hypothetical protein
MVDLGYSALEDLGKSIKCRLPFQLDSANKSGQMSNSHAIDLFGEEEAAKCESNSGRGHAVCKPLTGEEELNKLRPCFFAPSFADPSQLRYASRVKPV